ncbi:hypothetical protein ACFE04_029668 [Oxalis oulophora]
MTSIIRGPHCNWPIGVGLEQHQQIWRPKCSKFPFLASSPTSFSSSSSNTQVRHRFRSRKFGPVCSSTVDDNDNDNDNDNDDGMNSDEGGKDRNGEENSETLRDRDNLERMVGRDDSSFNGTDLATLIRNKYGRSYDVQLIKKEFMGKSLLALNVMWKYMEQRSFPLTEEEYILRLDDVANTLKCWGAVSHIRNSIQISKGRPRIGKAISIFIDMDESGGRANEWIYK